MSSYINADALIKALRLEYPMMPMFKENRKEWEFTTEGYRKAEKIITEAQTIDIVHCHECKWSDWYTTGDGKRYCYCLETDRGGYIANDFCSYGERKTDE